MLSRRPPSEAPAAFSLSNLKEGLVHAARIIARLYPDESAQTQDQLSRILSDANRACDAGDLEEVAMELSTLPLPEGTKRVETRVNSIDLLQQCIRAAVPLAEALQTRGIEEGLVDLQRRAYREEVDESFSEHYAKQLGIVAGGIHWLRRTADVFRISVRDLVNTLEPLASDEEVSHRRLVKLRERLEAAADDHELEQLRMRLVGEASKLVEEAKRRSDVAQDIRAHAARHRDQIAMLEAALEDARVLSRTDPLTGLKNRNALEEDTVMLAQSSSDVGVLVLDVDHFKNINDRFGHDMGDMVLREVSRRVQAELRGKDEAYRFGGEELVMLLSGTDLAGSEATAERIREAISSIPITADGQELRVTVSVGCAMWQSGKRFPEVLRAADQALYQAKHQGRNLVLTAS